MTKKQQLGFNPDELKLSKQDVLDQIDKIRKRWNKNKKDNWKLLISLEGMKAFVYMSSDETISAIWSEILLGFNDLLIENSIAIANGNNESWAKTFEKIKKRKEQD